MLSRTFQRFLLAYLSQRSQDRERPLSAPALADYAGIPITAAKRHLEKLLKKGILTPSESDVGTFYLVGDGVLPGNARSRDLPTYIHWGWLVWAAVQGIGLAVAAAGVGWNVLFALIPAALVNAFVAAAVTGVP